MLDLHPIYTLFTPYLTLFIYTLFTGLSALVAHMLDLHAAFTAVVAVARELQLPDTPPDVSVS